MANKKIKFFESGFTLAELLIVVVILGILASLTIPRFFPQAEKSRVAEALGMLSAIRQGEEAYRLENGAYLEVADTDPDTQWALLGLDNPNASSVYFTYETSFVGGNAQTFIGTATRTNVNSGADNAGKTVTLNNSGTFGGDHTFAPH